MAQRITIDTPGFNVPRVDLPAPSNQGAQIIEQAGQDLQRGVEVYAARRKERAHARAQLKLAQMEADDERQLVQDEYSGSISDGYMQSRGQAFDERAQATLDGAADDDEREFLANGMGLIRPRSLEAAFKRQKHVEGEQNYLNIDEGINQRGFILTSDPSQLDEQKAKAQAALDLSKGLSTERRTQLQNKINRMGEFAFERILNDHPKEALASLKDGTAGQKFGFDANQASAYMTRAENKIEVETNKSQAVTSARIDNQIEAYGRGDIDSKPDIPTGTDPDTGEPYVSELQRTNLEGRVAAADAKVAKATENYRNVVTKMQSNIPLDPADKDDKEGFDQYYQKVVAPALLTSTAEVVAAAKSRGEQDGQPLDNDELGDVAMNARNRQLVNWIQQRGMVPETVIGQIRATLRSGDARSRIDSANLYGQIVAANSQIKNDFQEEDVRLAMRMNQLRSAGMSPGDAVKKADDELAQRANLSDAEQSIIQQKYLDRIAPQAPSKINKNDQYLADKFNEGGWFQSNPALRDNLAAKFGDMVQREYNVNGNNLPLAQDFAFDNLRNIAGVSYVNGPSTVMRDAPENYYQVPGYTREQNGEWISAQAQDFAAEGTANPDDIRGYVRIEPIPDVKGKSLLGPNGKPVYALVIAKPGQPPVPVMKDGEAVAWQPELPSDKPRGLTEKERNARRIYQAHEGRVPEGLYVVGPTVFRRKGGPIVGRIVNGKYKPIVPSQPF